MKSPMNTIYELQRLIETWVDNPVARRSLLGWIEQNIIEVGNEVVITHDARKHTNNDLRLDERYASLAQREIGSKLYPSCYGIEKMDTLYGDTTIYRVYAIKATEK